jgi:hypothetical protein
MCVLIFLTNFVWNISHSNKNSAWYCHKRILVFTRSALYSCQISIKPEFSRQIFEKSSNIEYHENASSGSRVVSRGRADGRTDRQTQDGTNSSFPHFANAPKTRGNHHSKPLSPSVQWKHYFSSRHIQKCSLLHTLCFLVIWTHLNGLLLSQNDYLSLHHDSTSLAALYKIKWYKHNETIYRDVKSCLRLATWYSKSHPLRTCHL